MKILYAVLLFIPSIYNQRQSNTLRRALQADSDTIIFDDNDEFTRSNKRTGFNWNTLFQDTIGRTTLAVPGMETTPSPCEQRCQITPQYNPVCGSDDMTYSNPGRFRCAQKCGKSISLIHYGVCTSSLVLLRT